MSGRANKIFGRIKRVLHIGKSNKSTAQKPVKAPTKDTPAEGSQQVLAQPDVHENVVVQLDASDINVPIATTAPPSQFPGRQHPVQPEGLSGVDLTNPIETNKWWGTLPQPTPNPVTPSNPDPRQGYCFAFPYTLWWSQSNPSGMNIQHIEASQVVFASGTPPEYYLNPLGIISWNVGAKEFDGSMQLSLDTPTQFTVNVTLTPGSQNGSIKFPFVQGMAWTTAIYNGLTPLLQTVGRAIISFQTSSVGVGTKYKVSFNDGTTWLVYVIPSGGSSAIFTQSGSSLVANSPFNGVIQVAKIPIGDTTSESLYDVNAGTYVTAMTLFGNTSGSTGTYGFNFTATGNPNSVLHFALPHHQASFNPATQNNATGLYLKSTTMGMMRAYTGSSWTMTETLPSDILFLSPGLSATSYSANAISAINAAAQSDITQNPTAQANTGGSGMSQYFAGKALAKYAEICLVCNDILQNSSLTQQGIAQLTAAFQIFQSNTQDVPLCYDNTWKGLISTAGFSNSGADFGNTYYNDHHFHYGYFVYAAALLAHIDPSWLTPANIDYVNALVRDVANPSPQDPYFPVYRSFDWFVGHSWSKGLYFSADGKDEESSSEDYNFAYGMKLWGSVIGDSAMQARGDLMLAVQRRYLFPTKFFGLTN